MTTEERDLLIRGSLSLSDLRSIQPDYPLKSLCICDFALFHCGLALELNNWPAIEKLVLGGPVTRQALRHLVNIPSLKHLEVQNIRRHGSMLGLEIPITLSSIKIGFGANAKDITAIATGRGLTEICLESSFCSAKAVAALANLPLLKTLHLEGARFSDADAMALAKSDSIRHLYVQTTQLGAAGLASLCRMEQLESLDLWANRLHAEDLDKLRTLPNLSHLSVGQFEWKKDLKADKVVPRIANLRTLKSVWLDGVAVSQEQEKALRDRFDHVQVT